MIKIWASACIWVVLFATLNWAMQTKCGRIFADHLESSTRHMLGSGTVNVELECWFESTNQCIQQTVHLCQASLLVTAFFYIFYNALPTCTRENRQRSGSSIILDACIKHVWAESTVNMRSWSNSLWSSDKHVCTLSVLLKKRELLALKPTVEIPEKRRWGVAKRVSIFVS